MLPLSRTEAFLADVDRQINWYLAETDLDEIVAVELAQRFAAAVEETLEFLSRFPHAGRPRVHPEVRRRFDPRDRRQGEGPAPHDPGHGPERDRHRPPRRPVDFCGQGHRRRARRGADRRVAHGGHDPSLSRIVEEHAHRRRLDPALDPDGLDRS